MHGCVKNIFFNQRDKGYLIINSLCWLLIMFEYFPISKIVISHINDIIIVIFAKLSSLKSMKII